MAAFEKRITYPGAAAIYVNSLGCTSELFCCPRPFITAELLRYPNRLPAAVLHLNNYRPWAARIPL